VIASHFLFLSEDDHWSIKLPEPAGDPATVA
jgi:hypothetical protein